MASTSTYAIWQNTCTAANHHQFSNHKAESLETLNIRNSDELLALLIRTTTRALPLCSSTEVCPKRLCNQSSPHLPCIHAAEHGGETRNRRCMLRLSPDRLSIQASCTGPAECAKRLNKTNKTNTSDYIKKNYQNCYYYYYYLVKGSRQDHRRF